MPAIETTGLTKEYGPGVRAVDDLDLTVETGEVYGFLGPNGAGKSTTIDVLLDFVRPTAGQASVLGLDAGEDTREIHERVGVLPDGYGLYDRLDGRTHLEFAADLKSTDDDPDALADRVGLDPAALDRPVGGYSKGMTQRLALGMALVGQPDLVILDEPTSGLDPNGAREMREVILAENDRGATVFFSSHILEQVEAVCDRVGILRNGRLVAEGSLENLRDDVGGGSVITLSVADVPAGFDVGPVLGVTALDVSERAVRATCEHPEAKVAVIDAVREAGARVTDVHTDGSSLEEMFAAYTEGLQ
ncbi:ABC transporter ATP-binding protein [Halobacterium wangiae]|uniref:ABC transporter ATP-binding protein n=1 Tax=Halobacterium wangiae TaxID=2902623 RepID=UPI001E610B91|nr:ABC transporter ATP-binding protein [Halobacterium wangiae]